MKPLAGTAWFDLPKEAKLEKTKELGIEVDPELEDFEITNGVFEKIIEHLDPTHLRDPYSA